MNIEAVKRPELVDKIAAKIREGRQARLTDTMIAINIVYGILPPITQEELLHYDGYDKDKVYHNRPEGVLFMGKIDEVKKICWRLVRAGMWNGDVNDTTLIKCVNEQAQAICDFDKIERGDADSGTHLPEPKDTRHPFQEK